MSQAMGTEAAAHIFAADIGGTNSRFGHFAALADGSLRLEESLWLPTREADSFDDLLATLKEKGFSLEPRAADAVSVAVPGAVETPPCVFANIAWSLDFEAVKARLGLRRAWLVNDFLAQAYGCRSALVEDAEEILPGRPDPSKVQAIIGAGTGLGTAALIPLDGGGFTALPAEGGHTTIAFIDDREYEYFKFLKSVTGESYARGDTVVTGLGLSLVHRFLTGEELAPAEVSAKIGPDSETTAWFARFYGRSARNFALDVLASGGVFLSGGVAAKNPILARHPEFAREFRSSPAHGALLARIPVRLNRHQESGLYGAALYALARLGLGVRART